MADVANNLTVVKKKYENFERRLFEQKFSSTQNVIKDTAQLIEKIEISQGKLTQTALNAKKDL